MDVPSYLLGKNAGGGGGSITETDPIFSASAAAGITADDIAKLGSITPTYLGKISEHNTSETAISLDGLKAGFYSIFADEKNLYLSVKNTTSDKIVTGSTITGTNENSYIWYSTVYLYIKNDIPSGGLPTSSNEIAKVIYMRNNLYGQSKSFVFNNFPITVQNNFLNISTTGASTHFYSTADENETITGKKTFTTLPESSVVPTTNNQLVNKAYVDAQITGALGGSY